MLYEEDHNSAFYSEVLLAARLPGTPKHPGTLPELRQSPFP